MQGMMTDDVIPLLQKQFSTAHIVHRTLLTFGIGESMLADMIQDFEEALRLNPLDPDSRWGLAHALVLMDDHAAAAAELEKADAVTKQVVAKYGPQVWALFFNPATTYAQAHAKALVDPKLSAERREELATKYVTRAIELLTQAQRAAAPKFAADFLKELRGDTSLNPIRQRPEFLEALKSLTPATKP